MKISVSYNDRTYGNSKASEASEVKISGGSGDVNLKIQFKSPQPGRSWDWASSATVGSAEIDMSFEDAKAIGNALLAYSALHEQNGSDGITEATLRLRKGIQPEQDVRGITREQWYAQIRRWLQKK